MQKRIVRSEQSLAKIFCLAGLILTGAWLATGLFIAPLLPRTIASFSAALLLIRGARRWFKSRHLLHCREQYRGLLEHLLSRLSAGWTLERAFMDAPAGMSRQAGEKTDLSISLHRIAALLESKHPFDNLLFDLETRLPLPEARAAFRILPILNRAGCDTYRFLQSNHRLASRQLILQNELDADHAQRRTEAIILSLMPFAMAFFLRQSEQFATENTGAAQGLQPGLIVAWSLSVLAVILVVNVLSLNHGSISRKARRPSAGKTQPQSRIDRTLLRLYRRLIPKRMCTTLFRAIEVDSRSTEQTADQLTRQYFKTKKTCMAVGFLPVLAAMFFHPKWVLPAALFPVAFAIIQDRQLLSRVKRRTLEDQFVYPIFLNIALALLHAGLSLHQAMAITIDSLPHQLINDTLCADLSQFKRRIAAGVTASTALEEMSSGNLSPQIQSALGMMARYGCDGGPENLQILQIQVDACWALHHQALRKKTELAMLRLLIPMTLDLTAVMLTVLLPAIQMIQKF
ncbi:MAG: hypothetical protein GX276_03275 [Clostridiaceae bacterium]|nr:hypothetical protein [Clostridiaceae bacterium]